MSIRKIFLLIVYCACTFAVKVKNLKILFKVHQKLNPTAPRVLPLECQAPLQFALHQRHFAIAKCDYSSREKPCQFSPQFSFFLTSDINRPFLHFKGVDIETNKTFMEQFMSLCTVSKSAGMNIFAAMFLDRVKDFINFKLECPLKQVFSRKCSFDSTPKTFVCRDYTNSEVSRNRKVSICWWPFFQQTRHKACSSSWVTSSTRLWKTFTHFQLTLKLLKLISGGD